MRYEHHAIAATHRAPAWIIAVAAWSMLGCASLPPLEGRGESSALSATDGTPLGRAIAARVAGNPGKAGIHALPLPTDAFAARALIASVAESSLDAQYYIWHADQSGYFLFDMLWQAAERGVRVRLLLDDANTAGLDATIIALDAHPNIEVRLYNPLLYRGARGIDFATDFARVNRRMHNKAFIADNQVAIVGGRNIGDEYLGATDKVVFADLDVIAVGPVVRKVSTEFDLYWNSRSAYPAAAVIAPSGRDDAAMLRARFADARADPRSAAYAEAVRATPILRELLAGQLAFEWTDAVVLSDNPAKTLDSTGRNEGLLLTQLLGEVGRPVASFDLISPYFVPGEGGTASLAALAQRGVQVRILTNSLAATDVIAVHAGYAKRRRDLLAAGVRLYELKPTAFRDDPKDKQRFGLGSSSSLHAKTFAVDRKRVFVGSFNFDQRSAYLNTEMGLLIESPTLAQRMSNEFETSIREAAYEVRLLSDGQLEWIDRAPGGVIRLYVEPGTSAWTRSMVQFLSVLPIEWLL